MSDHHDQRIEELEIELALARETNRTLHRRVQAEESQAAMMLRETGYHEMKRQADMWSVSWKREFDRLLRSHQQVKAIYEVCAKALRLPFGRYHSVGDIPFGRPIDGKLYANVMPLGGELSVHELVETVQKLADIPVQEWAAARGAFLALPPGSPDARAALDRLANAEQTLYAAARQ